MALVKKLDDRVTNIIETTRKEVLDAISKKASDQNASSSLLLIEGMALPQYLEAKYAEADALSDEKMALAKKNYERVHRFKQELEDNIERLKEKSLNTDSAGIVEEPIPSLFPPKSTNSNNLQQLLKDGKKREKNQKLADIGGLCSPSQTETGSGRSGVAHLEEHNQKLLVSSGADLWTKKNSGSNVSTPKKADADLSIQSGEKSLGKNTDFASPSKKKAQKRPRESQATNAPLSEEKPPKRRNTSSKSVASKSVSSAQKNPKKTTATLAQQAPTPAATEAVSQVIIDEGDQGDADAVYCICRQKSYGEMIECDCCGEWFHFACIGMTVAPPEGTAWYCEKCRKLSYRDREHKKKRLQK